MRGNLDNPPIVIQQERSALLSTLIAIVLVTIQIGASISQSMTPSPRWQYVLIGWFGFGILFMGWLLWRPGSLTLDQDGLVYRYGFGRSRYRWDDFSHFESVTGKIDTAYGIFAEHNQSGRLAGDSVLLSMPFGEEDGSTLVELLSAAHSRWRRAKVQPLSG